jgi:hypothetical protein
LASASSEVFSPTMISTSGILSTGEKKWMPMKFSGLAAGLGELRDRQRRGVRAPDAALGQLALELPGHRRA